MNGSLDALSNRLLVRIPPTTQSTPGSLLRVPFTAINQTSMLLALDLAILVPETASDPVQPATALLIEGKWWIRHENSASASTAASPDADGTCDAVPMTNSWFAMTSACRFVWCDAIRRTTWSLQDSWSALRTILNLVSPDDTMFARRIFSPGGCVLAVCDGVPDGPTPDRVRMANLSFPRIGPTTTLWLEIRIGLRTGAAATTLVRVWQWPVGDPSVGLGGPSLWRFASMPISRRWVDTGGRCPATNPAFPRVPALGISLQGQCPELETPESPPIVIIPSPLEFSNDTTVPSDGLIGPDAATAGLIVAALVGAALIFGLIAFCQHRLRNKEQNGGITDSAEDGPILISEDEHRSSRNRCFAGICKFKKRTCRKFCCCCCAGTKPRSQRSACVWSCCGPTRRPMPQPKGEIGLSMLDLQIVEDPGTPLASVAAAAVIAGSSESEQLHRRSKKSHHSRLGSNANGAGSPSTSEDDVVDVSGTGSEFDD